MTTAKDIVHIGARCVSEHETLAAAQHMRDLGVGALPICGATTASAKRTQQPTERPRSCRLRSLPTGLPSQA